MHPDGQKTSIKHSRTFKVFKKILKKLSPTPKTLSISKAAIGPFWNLAAGRFLSENTSLEQLGSRLTRELDAPPSALGL